MKKGTVTVVLAVLLVVAVVQAIQINSLKEKIAATASAPAIQGAAVADPSIDPSAAPSDGALGDGAVPDVVGNDS